MGSSNFLNDIFNLHALRFTHLFKFIWLCWVLVVTWYVGFSIFIAACKIFNHSMWTLSCNMWNLVPRPGIEPRPPALEKEVLATGPPGKSHGSLSVLSHAMGFDQCLCRASTASGSHSIGSPSAVPTLPCFAYSTPHPLLKPLATTDRDCKIQSCLTF